ncbi:MAG: peptidoglycan-associated lipoprotein Pal [Alphaproteobacteria bacterium]|nr:peptidoglycan-associated lipoprotein Pal [Alphaproteobacteria bacterium]
MNIKALSILAAVALLAACSSDPATSTNTTSGGNNPQTATTTPGTTAGGGGGAGTRAVRPGSQEDLVVNVGDRVFFDYDKFDLKPEARAVLDRQAAWMRQFGSVNLTVEGHCDERGTREYNLALGERRANAAKDYLVAKGVPAARLKIISYGKERPAVLGSNEAAWAQNRRSVSVVN